MKTEKIVETIKCPKCKEEMILKYLLIFDKEGYECLSCHYCEVKKKEI